MPSTRSSRSPAPPGRARLGHPHASSRSSGGKGERRVRRGRQLPPLRPRRDGRRWPRRQARALRFTHFGAEANLFAELEELFRIYGETGTGKIRKYLHDEAEAAPYGQQPGTFTPWEDLPADTDLLFYEGLHGAVVTDEVDIARHGDLLIGVVPIINLEWIQKLHRDKAARGYTAEAVTETILRRMPDYVNYMCPQFSHTHVNFQRVPSSTPRTRSSRGTSRRPTSPC